MKRRLIRMTYRGIHIQDYLNFSKYRLMSTVRPYTLLSYARLNNLYEMSRFLEREKMPGAFVELGVCNGGSAGILGNAARGNPQRQVWLFDSWEGLPEPGPDDLTSSGRPGAKGMCLGSLERVKELLFNKLNLAEDRMHLMKGWFNVTLPAVKAKIGPIALLHLDSDWYESTKFCLEELYDQVVPGGFIVIDDYGYWTGCKKAVDEFLANKGLHPELVQVDHTGVYFEK
ncbi:MAG: hypothetical protein FJ134_05735 [Deltaproteobacteria bacterium]|nr:hypothetical protein [Deltaproteobacteria bacterium]